MTTGVGGVGSFWHILSRLGQIFARNAIKGRGKRGSRLPGNLGHCSLSDFEAIRAFPCGILVPLRGRLAGDGHRADRLVSEGLDEAAHSPLGA